MTQGTEVKEGLAREGKRLQEDALLTFKALYNTEDIWERRHFSLGIPAATLGGTAGTGALLPWWDWLVALTAFLAAFFAGAMTVMNPAQRARAAGGVADNMRAFHGRIRRWVDLDLPEAEQAIARKQLDALANEKEEILKGAPSIPDRAFRKAQRGIAAGEATYEVDG